MGIGLGSIYLGAGGGGGPPAGMNWQSFTLPITYGQQGGPNWAGTSQLTFLGGEGTAGANAGNCQYQYRPVENDSDITTDNDIEPDVWWLGAVDTPLGEALTIECTDAVIDEGSLEDIDDVFTANGASTPGIGYSDQLGESISAGWWQINRWAEGIGLTVVTASFEVTETVGGAFVDSFDVVFQSELVAPL